MMNDPMKTQEEVSYGKWMLTLLLQAIPIVNIIMLLIWAFDDYDGRKNYARATLTYYGISIVLSILLMLAIGSSLASLYAGV